ncbi:hypothetical protein [Spongiactinospora sp. TRM90649]|uniref:hypothetical protein n=1 Tax=Spongiactinospora sp. TRM90649 TaxID=3031114 RepID=UPI0023F66BF3|nr:hypothetical protein [Spongiactinospora sp. TRM90649]MDF5751762.1 hypothetical protein [Spongiactinospora sp. TRM90649]
MAPALRRWVADRSVVGRSCVVAFVADRQSGSPFLLPVRHALVADAECAAGVCVFRLRMGDYTDLDDYPVTEDELRAEGHRYLDQLIALNDGQFYLATGCFPSRSMANDGMHSGPARWAGAAGRLAQHPTFRDSYFIRIDEPVLDRGGPVPFDEQGRLLLSDRRAVRLKVWFRTHGSVEGDERRLSCVTDGAHLRISFEDFCDIGSPYDAVEFWLQPSPVGFDALTRVTVAHGREGEHPEISAGFPVVVRRSRSRLLTRVTLSALGAFMIGLPAIVGADSPLLVRVLFAIVGTALLSVSTIAIVRGGS